MARRSNRAYRNLAAAGSDAARLTAKTTEKAAAGLFRWATTDHSGMTKALENMPQMGFIDTIRYIFMQFLIAVVGVILSAIWIYLLIAYGIPFLITGHF
jgi:hypothetical protein